MELNKLIHCDCKDALEKMPSESVDLIYLDPPFFTNRQYEVLWGDSADKRSFDDRWAGGINHFLAWLTPRVDQMHRVLKPSGSLYLHCDWHAGADIKCYVLDKIFGRKGFVNEIIWQYTWGYHIKTRWNRKHDNIWMYAKNPDAITFNWQNVMDDRHISPATEKRLLYEGAMIKDHNKSWESAMKLPGDVWYIPTLNIAAKERMGYPTQKPEKLLERIIIASSNEGDIVLDPFVGGGTTVAVAERLNRKWIGIDNSAVAINLTEIRLNKFQGIFEGTNFEVRKQVYDYDDLRKMEPFEFEKWIIQQFGGESNTKQRSDSGIDGKMPDGTPIQVKRSDNIGRNIIDNFQSAAKRFNKNIYDENIKNKKTIGHIIAFSFGRGVKEEIGRLKMQEGIDINLVEVKDIISIASRPHIEINILQNDDNQYELTFIATPDADVKIAGYNWDFNYKSDVGFNACEVIDERGKKVGYMDLLGKQTKIFEPGTYIIAVRAVDANMLNDIFTIKLKVNGGVNIF